MTPLEFMARLSALIPPPRLPRIRHHGVFSSRSSYRPLVVPKVPKAHRACDPNTRPPAGGHGTDGVTPKAPSNAKTTTAASATSSAVQRLPAPLAAQVIVSPQAIPSVRSAQGTLCVSTDVTTISVAPWTRLEQGALLAKTTYVDRAVLMRRTWGLDVLACPKCHRRLRVMATITDPDVIGAILEHLNLALKPPPRAAARRPAWDQQDLAFDVA
jgi:hypothetical protein